MNKKNKKGMYNNLVFITQIGITIVTSIFIGLFIGKFLDNKLGTKWVFTLIFLVMGAIGGFINLFKLTGTSSKKRK